MGDALLAEAVQVRLLRLRKSLEAFGAEEVHVGVGSRFNGHDEQYLECPVGALLEDDAVRGLVAVAEVDLPAVGQVARGGHGRQRLAVSAAGGDVGQDASGFGGQDRVVLLQALEIGNRSG